MDVIDIVIDLLPTIVDIITTLIRLADNIVGGALPVLSKLKDFILALIKPIKTVIGWITDLLDLIGKFLGQSSKLSNKSSAAVRTITQSEANAINASKAKQPKIIRLNTQPNVIHLNDFILSKGRIIKPNKQDTIIGTKNPGAMGGMTIIIEGDVNGTDPEQMAEAFARELKRSIRI